MKIGYLSSNHGEGIKPQDLAVELEARGFDSLWVPEHSHIPTSRATKFPSGGELPDAYVHMMDPLTSLAAAAAVTSDLLLYTGVCLVLEHDLLALATGTATVDVLSGGRLRFGVGVGWNREELRNHRPDLPFSARYLAMKERIAALRTAWTEPVASFEGRWDRFEESWIFPKPVKGAIPVALGNAGPLGIDHAAEYADEWCPVDAAMFGGGQRPDVPSTIRRFRERVAAFGRDPYSVPISILCMGPVVADRIRSYAELGVERVVLWPPSMNLASARETLNFLDDLGPVFDDLRSSGVAPHQNLV